MWPALDRVDCRPARATTMVRSALERGLKMRLMLPEVVEAAEKGLGVDETEEAAAWSGLDMVPTAEAVPSGLCAISTERIAPTRLGLSRNEPSWNRGLHFRSNRPTSSRSAPDQIEAEGGDSASRSRRWLEPAEGGWSKRRRRRW
jgi:hypothetical protein